MATANRTNMNTDVFQKGFSLILEAKEEDALKREKLEVLLSETAVCVHGMDESLLAEISKDFPDIKKTFEDRIQQVHQRDYYILVAGETSAGKSCFINLLLGFDLLPYSTLSTTSTICEIKYGEQPKLVAHFSNKVERNGPPLKPKVVKLQREEDCGKTYRKQIDPYVNRKKDRDKGIIYDKVEIFWPHELLKVGIVIIDSPGVGESEIMDDILMSYLPKAFAFIYIISSSNAGGIQKDRLVKILDQVRSLESKHDYVCHGFAKCALFVANKWDQVDEEERPDVKQFIVERLQQFWPEGNPHEQIVYVSTKNALEQQKSGVITKEYDDLLEGIKSMILKAINNRLNNHWAWVNIILNRIIFRIEGFNNSMLTDREERIQKMNTLHRNILDLQNARYEEISELKEKFEKKTETLVDTLYNYIRSDEFVRKFTIWEADEIPASEDSWVATKGSVKKAVKKRFETLLTRWEEENGVYAQIHNELVHCFEERFLLAEAEIKSIEDTIYAKHSHSSNSEKDGGEHHLNIRAKVAIGATSPLWITVGVASLFIAFPYFAVKKIIERAKSVDYRNDCGEYLMKTSKNFLDSVNEDTVRDFVKEQLRLAKAMLEEYETRIPRILEANKITVLRLRDETRSRDEVWQFNLPVYKKCVQLQRILSKFGILIWSETISYKQLTWNNDSLIGEGEFSAVYSAVLTQDGRGNSEKKPSSLNVAVKVFEKPFDCANANYFLKNETKLRQLQHQNLCKFFGSTIYKDHVSPENYQVILVMELYQKNLRSVVFNNDFTCPANSGEENAAVLTRFLQWALEIADALAYIHSMKLIHKHLKMENILVSSDESLKLSDVGILGQDEVTDENMIYSAPEVLHSYNYSQASDNYSLGLMFWEMWYGKQVFSEILPLEKHVFIQRVINGCRPQFSVALPRVQTLLQYCLTNQKDMRTTASRAHGMLVDALKEIQSNKAN